MTEQLDVWTLRGEPPPDPPIAPGEEEPDILPICLQRSAAVASQERHRRQLRLVHLGCDENLIKPNPIR